MTLSQGQRGNDFLAQIGYPHFDEERIDKKELCLLKFSSIKIVKTRVQKFEKWIFKQ